MTAFGLLICIELYRYQVQYFKNTVYKNDRYLFIFFLAQRYNIVMVFFSSVNTYNKNSIAYIRFYPDLLHCSTTQSNQFWLMAVLLTSNFLDKKPNENQLVSL